MIPEKLHPTVYWHQTDNNVYLSIDIDNPKDIKVQFDDNLAILFVKKNNEQDEPEKVALLLEFYGTIDYKESNYDVIDKQLQVILKKTVATKWARLSSFSSDPSWIRDNTESSQSKNTCDEKNKDEKAYTFRNPNRETNVHTEELEIRDIHQDYPRLYDELHKEEFGYKKEDLKKVYLVLYNLCQYIGFMYVLIVMIIRYSREGPDCTKDTYNSVGNAMKFIQLLQFLEVMHPAFGYTKGNTFVALLQVSGRAFILFCMIDAEPRMQTKPVVFYLFFVWSWVEIFRYPYYITQLLDVSIPVLTWLRYTMWIPLYPLGFLCEGTIVLRNIPYFEETNKFTISLPNSWNFSFHFPSILRIYLLLLCFPGFYTMMSHMSKTRKKKLGKQKIIKVT